MIINGNIKIINGNINWKFMCNALGYNFKQLYQDQTCNQNMIHKTKYSSVLLVSENNPMEVTMEINSFQDEYTV